MWPPAMQDPRRPAAWRSGWRLWRPTEFAGFNIFVGSLYGKDTAEVFNKVLSGK